jgi:hypothetical protein
MGPYVFFAGRAVATALLAFLGGTGATFITALAHLTLFLPKAFRFLSKMLKFSSLLRS